MAFEGLSDKLQRAFKKLTGKGKLNEQNVKDAMSRCAWCCSKPTSTMLS